ncbi:MAG: sigma-70 family RNA polymerase sigma factor [Planctomycetes bacterium]|nr:sigma-70 family RNA polymerase sigma factor [Planctomycetota bacterium]
MSQYASNKVNDGDGRLDGAVEAPIRFDDTALIAACQKGQMHAFGALVAKYQDRLFNALLRMCGNREDAADLCQEAFVRAIEKIGGFRGQSQFYTWLFRIGVNLAISRRRRAGRVKFTSLSPDPDLGDSQAAALTAGADGDPARQAATADAHRRVMEAIDALDDAHRVVVVLRDVENMDYDQIAEVLAISKGTVKSRLHRARTLLREKLAGLIDPIDA